MNYARVYEELVERAKLRSNEGYVEHHHIIPKAHGGTNEPANIVALTAREHYVAHWLLVKIYKTPAMARAFRLLCDVNNNRRGRGYETAKITYANSMRGDNNVAKQAQVRQKISSALKQSHPYRGKKRPKHAELLKSRGYWAGENSMWFGKGDRQIGTKNHMARSVIGIKDATVREWGTLKSVADELGVTIQAVCQALRKAQKSKGWKLEYKQ